MTTSSHIPVSYPTLGKDTGKGPHLPFAIEVRPEGAGIPLDELLDWITEIQTQREEHLHRTGAILFRGFAALRTAEDFAAVAQRMAPEILDYAGGTTPRSAVTGKIVTSTDAPRHAVIGLHQEMSYLAPSPEFSDPTPDKVMFFCETAPGGGGQTPIADMRAVYKNLPQELIDRFEQRGGLILHRKLPAHKRYGFEVTWTTAFGAPDRNAMEKLAQKNEWQTNWAKDGGLDVTHAPSPGADGSEISLADLACIRRAVAGETVLFDWRRGDLLLIDNKLVAHGRQPYQPPRTIFAALLADIPRKRLAASPPDGATARAHN